MLYPEFTAKVFTLSFLGLEVEVRLVKGKVGPFYLHCCMITKFRAFILVLILYSGLSMRDCYFVSQNHESAILV